MIADEQQQSPLTYRDERRIDRLTASTRQVLVRFPTRPNPPRGLAYAAGTLQWDAPADSPQITHYRVYLDDESNLVREVSVGQQYIGDLPSADRVFVSSFNKNSGLESLKVLLTQTIGISLTNHGVLLGQGTSPVVASGAGTVGQPFLSGGASADGAYGSLEVLEGVASATLTCSTSMQDVAGATVTLAKDGVWVITGIFEMVLDTTANDCRGELDIFYSSTDHVQAGEARHLYTGTNTSLVTVLQRWKYTNSGSRVAKLRARKTGAGGTAQVGITNSKILAEYRG